MRNKKVWIDQLFHKCILKNVQNIYKIAIKFGDILKIVQRPWRQDESYVSKIVDKGRNIGYIKDGTGALNNDFPEKEHTVLRWLYRGF